MSGRARLVRVVRVLAVAAAVGLLLVVLAIVGMMTLTPAARLVVELGLSRSPVEARIASVQGSLRGPLVLEGVEAEQDGATVRVERIVLDWRPLALLGRRVLVDSLHVDGVTVFVPAGWTRPVRTEPPPERTGPPSVPELPIDVHVGSLRLRADRVEAEGRAEVHTFELSASGSPDDLTAELMLDASAAPIEALRATARFAGAPEAYRLEALTEFTSAGLPAVRGALGTHGTLTSLTVDSARIDTEHGFAELTAEVGWYPEVTWRLESLGDLLDIAPLTPDPASWPGQLSFRVRSEGRMAESGVVASAVVEDLSGTLRGAPLTGSLDAEVATPEVEVSELRLRWGEIDLEAAGAVLDTADFRFDVDVPDIGQLRPGAGGRVRAQGTLTGTRDRPRVVAALEAEAVTVDSLAVGRATADVDLDLHPEALSRVEARIERLDLGARVVDSLTVGAEGRQDDHRIRLGAWMPEAGVSLAGAGSVTLPAEGVEAVWAGRLDSLELATRDAGAWRLREAVALHASADSVLLERACLVQGPTGACVAVTRDGTGALDGEATIDGLPLSALPMELPEGTTIEGRVDGSALFRLDGDGTLRTEGGLTLEGAMSALAGADTARFAFGGEGMSFVVDSVGGRAELRLALVEDAGEGRFEVTAEARLPGFTSLADSLLAQPVEVTASVTSDDLSFLAPFVPTVSGLGGRFALESQVSGTLGSPAVRGRAGLEGGHADIPAAGLQLRDIELAFEGDQERELSITGAMRSGEGSLRVEGRAPVEPSPADPATVRVTGDRFLAVGTPEIRLEIAPDLEVRYDGALVNVGGSVSVPWARVELLEIPESAVSPSSDVVIVDEEPVATPEVDATITVSVGDDVRFSGFGFSSLIEGELRVREVPDAPPSVLGELRFVDGSYRAYGQNLEIDPGRIVFTGQPEDATLDVIAARTAADGTVAGLSVRGSATAPEVDLTSEPAMADVDVLSYIIYGHPLSDDASEQGQVAGAAATLGANVITTRIASRVGLDDARIEGTSREQAELVAGKYLTPSVYVSYGVGLFKPSNTFRIKYLLNSNWAVQAESGDANGGDILYQIERGR